MRRNYETYLRRFHEAKWDEEMIFDLSVPGQRGIVVPKAEAEIVEKIGKGSEKIPDSMKRKKLPNLPEVHQMRVNRHYMRLTQEVLGADITPDLSQGTCTMKYSPTRERFKAMQEAKRLKDQGKEYSTEAFEKIL